MSRKQLTLILALQLLAVVSVGAYLLKKSDMQHTTAPPTASTLPVSPEPPQRPPATPAS